MIKAVIFDFDHTLYDREKNILATAPVLWGRLREYLRPEVTAEQFTKALLIAETSENGYYEAGYQGVLDELERLEVLAVKPEKKAYSTLFYAAMSENIALFPDAYAVLEKLKEQGYRIALLTNGKTESQWMKLSHTRVPDYMEEIIVTDELGIQKPNPKTFITMCRRLGIRTDEAVYVGDNIINDICGARGAGLIPVWFPFAREWPKDVAPPDHIIHSLSEVFDVLEKLK